MKKNAVRKTLLLVSSLLVSLILCEIALRAVNDDQFYIWPPNLKQYFLPDASIFPGIKDTSFFRVNALGLRGDEKNDSDAVNIVAIGGSTTECLYLNQNETWPALLERYLNQNSDRKFRVYNGGRSGLTSQHHVTQIQKLLESQKWIDIIIVLQGINDLQYSLALGNQYARKDPQTIYDESFLISPLNDRLPFYKHSYLYVYLAKVKKAIQTYKLGQDPHGYQYVQWRKNRANALGIVDTMPALDSSLCDFQKNTTAIIDMVKAKRKRVVFLTQPVSWDEKMPIAQQKLCWFGWIGKNQNENSGRYYSFSHLKQSMDKYNTLLKEICAANDVECIAIESMLEKDTTTFYDDCHFNESGANKAAKIVSVYMNRLRP